MESEVYDEAPYTQPSSTGDTRKRRMFGGIRVQGFIGALLLIGLAVIAVQCQQRQVQSLPGELILDELGVEYLCGDSTAHVQVVATTGSSTASVTCVSDDSVAPPLYVWHNDTPLGKRWQVVCPVGESFIAIDNHAGLSYYFELTRRCPPLQSGVDPFISPWLQDSATERARNRTAQL